MGIVKQLNSKQPEGKKNMPEVQSNIEEITFGVEFETLIPTNSVRVGGYHSGLPVFGAPMFQSQCWKAERDGSIVPSRGTQACEFVSPILKGEAGVAHLVEFVAWLNSIGAKVNNSCGFHIHVGIAGYLNGATSEAAVVLFVNKLARVSSFYSSALYAQTGTVSRETGMYCTKPGEEFKKTIQMVNKSKTLGLLCRNSRYQMLNLTNVSRNRTVEFRCFAGTTNANKVLVHLFSVLGLCRIAAQLESVPVWEAKNLTGRQSVWNLLKVRPMRRLVSCKPFSKQWNKMVAMALVMASQYDAVKAGRPASATPGVQD